MENCFQQRLKVHCQLKHRYFTYCPVVVHSITATNSNEFYSVQNRVRTFKQVTECHMEDWLHCISFECTGLANNVPLDHLYWEDNFVL
jgi:hypothetical protein